MRKRYEMKKLHKNGKALVNTTVFEKLHKNGRANTNVFEKGYESK